MNILHITTFLQGGAGQMIAELACSQAQSGHRVTVAASGKSEQDYGNYPEWVDRLKSAAVRLVFVESTFKRDLPLNLAAFRQISEGLDCASLTLMHAHASIPSLVALLLRSRVKRAIPIIQTMHGWGIRKDPEQETTDVTLMNQVDRVITPSEASRQLLARLGVYPDLLHVVPYGIAHPPPQVFNEQLVGQLKEWKSKGHLVLVCIGDVGPRKNQRLLLNAMLHPEAPKRIACAFVGDGNELTPLSAMAHECGLGDRVHFFGYQRDSAQFLSNADWLVLPSRDEGLPLSILESYRARVPVIGSDIPEISEAVTPGQTGILFQAGSLDSLVRALAVVAKISEMERIRIGTESRRLWEERYTLTRMLDLYNGIYLDLINNRN